MGGGARGRWWDPAAWPVASGQHERRELLGGVSVEVGEEEAAVDLTAATDYDSRYPGSRRLCAET